MNADETVVEGEGKCERGHVLGMGQLNEALVARLGDAAASLAGLEDLGESATDDRSPDAAPPARATGSTVVPTFRIEPHAIHRVTCAASQPARECPDGRS